MTIEQFVDTYCNGLDGQEKVPFDKLVALLEDLAERGCGGTQNLTATASDAETPAAIGAGTGWVNVTAGSDANAIIYLPKASTVEVGHIVRGSIGATGCEIRVAVDDDATVYLNNNKTTANEAALAANASFMAMLVAADRWILHNYSSAGALTAPTPD